MSDALAPVELRLADLDAEPHVVESLRVAGSLTGGLCGAGDVLLAVILAAGRVKSEAFRTFRSLIPGKIDVAADESRKLRDVRLTRGLGESWNHFGASHGTSHRLWGRDLITIALLAEYDPTLYEFCMDAGVAVDQLQEQWFAFLESNSGRKTATDHAATWSAAGIPTPVERSLRPATAFLASAFPDGEPSVRAGLHLGSFFDLAADAMVWTLINRQHLVAGDRLFVLAGEQGEARIVNVGTVLSPPPTQNVATKGGTDDPNVEIQWLGDKQNQSPVIEHADLLAIDPEIATWSGKATGLRLRSGQVAAFESLLAGESVPGPVTPDILHYAKTLSDLDHKNDWIGIRPDVEALSTLVAVDQVKPPLSVAIFGDWGSGKTFLLRKIQERVGVLEQLGKKTAAAREEARTGGGPDAPHYCGSILQIEFNAWHYTESNLWASLVNTIFEKIYDTLTENRPEAETSVDELFQNFETARHARQAAEEETERLGTELEAAASATTTAATAATAARDHLAATVSRNVWTRLDEVIKNKQDEHQTEVEQLEKAFKHFGFGQALTSAQTIDDTVCRFQSVSGRAREVFGSLLATPRGLFGAGVVVVLTIGVPIFADRIGIPISNVGAAIAASLAWLTERGATANRWLAKIEAFSNWFAAEKQRAESEQAAEVESARADLELRQAALLAAQQRQQEAARHESRAKAELESLTARDQMRRFVDERVTSRAYAQHLGLVSMIRSDFEELTRFMNREQETEEIELIARIKATTEDAAIDAIPTIDRIVLYIDDLDRCQPDRVVEVLEAIHLLLAFRLFIVIVAVDPRWVLESLTQKYVHLARARSEDQAKVTVSGYHTAATAHDYLEKIFHIPFWVRPMAPVAAEKLIEGFLELGHRAGTSAEQSADRDAERFNSLENVDVEDVAEEPAPEISDTGGTGGPPAPESAPAPATLLRAEKHRRREQETAAAAAHIATVVITEDEDAFIRQLSPYFGNSPRRVKRFANSYRLIKSGLSRAESERLNRHDDHRIVLAFLAVVTGAPNHAPGIFVEILRKRGGKLDPSAIASGLQEGADPCGQQEILAARGALRLLGDLEITREQVEMWVPRVIRHAFRMIPGSLPLEEEAAG